MKMLKPLRWPEGWNRTQNRLVAVEHRRGDKIQEIVELMAAFTATNVICTANVDVTDHATGTDEPGVALYFNLAGRPYVIASDRYTKTPANFHDIHGILSDIERLLVFGETIQDRALQGFTELPPEKAGIAWPLHWMRLMGTLPDWNRMMPETQRRWIDQRYAELMLQPMSEQAFRDLRQARVEAFADVGAYVIGEKE